MSYKCLKEILFDIDEYDFEESSAKMQLNYQDLDDKNERAEKYAKELLDNPKRLIKPYGKDTIMFLKSLCESETGKNFDMDYNTLVCDGICYIEKVNGVELINTTDDFKKSFLEMMKDESILDLIDSYEKTETVIAGIIKTYAAITAEDLFDIFIDVKVSSEDEFEDEDEFDHFIYHRDEIVNNFLTYDYDDEEYIIIEDLIDVDEVIDDITNSDKKRRVLSREEYMTFAHGNNYVTDEKALEDFRELIDKMVDGDKAKTDDIVNTVMYDIKMGNLDDLMLDIMTYVDLDTEGDHENIKDKLSTLYEKTPTWFGEYLSK